VVPGLGEVYAENLIKEDFSQVFSAYLGKYIRNPRVSVDIVKYASQVVYVLGHVNNPGRYPTAGKTITLRDAIILAGLPRRFAASSRVFVITASRQKNPTRRVINLYRVLYRGELKMNVKLNPGAVVYVPRTILGVIVDFLSELLSPFNSVSSAQSVASP